MHVGSTSKRLPMLVDLMAMPPPRRSFWRPVLLLGCLAAVAAFALSVYRSPEQIDFGAQWDRLRAAVTARVHPTDLISVTANPPLPRPRLGVPAAPETTPDVQDTSPPAPAGAALADTAAASASDTPNRPRPRDPEAPSAAPRRHRRARPQSPPAPALSPSTSPPPPVASADSPASAPSYTPPATVSQLRARTPRPMRPASSRAPAPAQAGCGAASGSPRRRPRHESSWRPTTT